MERKKVVVLNSGGFDSTVLIHKVRDEQGEDCEIHSLFFDYGQRSLEQESYWSEYNAKKVGAIHHVIALPKFSWTTGEFYQEGWDYKTQYLEWRNLVFMSYAFSFAESIKAEMIFLATLRSHGYKDTSEVFLAAMNMLDRDIEVVAPFKDMDGKYDGLVDLAFYYGIKPNHFHSCDNPKENGEPCGYCTDCLDIQYANEELKIDTPIKAYRRNRSATCKEFNVCALFTNPREIRILWNNDCQLSCKHCFYGFKEMFGTKLTTDEFLEVTKQALELGIRSVHISGKEPLYNESVIEYIERLNQFRGEYQDLEISLVTNGINFPKYAKALRAAGLDKIFVSADDVVEGSQYVRATNNKVLLDSILAARINKIDLEVFVNIHKHNFDKVTEILEELEAQSVKQVYFNIVREVGSAEENKLERLEPLELLELWDSLMDYSPIQDDFYMGLSLNMYYTNMARSDSRLSEIQDALEDMLYSGVKDVNDVLSVDAEFYCASYLENITLTPDGYLLGCAIDVSDKDYYTYKYAGNVRNESLEELIKIGKERRNFYCNKCLERVGFTKCPHELGV